MAEASYNGVTFGVRTETLGIECRPARDQAGRAISHIVHSISLKTTIAADPDSPLTPDEQLEGIRTRLQQDGGALKFVDKGFGNFTVNTAAPGAEGEARDVAWGPKPQLLRWKPLGNNQAAEVTWTVEVAVPECFAPLGGTVRPMEACYRVQWSVDGGGYQRRTVTGYLLIPMTRHNPGDPSLPDSAD